MFYVVEVNKEKSGANSQAILAYDTLDAAVVAFHQSVAYAMSNENVTYMARTILDEAMNYVSPRRIEVYERLVSEEDDAAN